MQRRSVLGATCKLIPFPSRPSLTLISTSSSAKGFGSYSCHLCNVPMVSNRESASGQRGQLCTYLNFPSIESSPRAHHPMNLFSVAIVVFEFAWVCSQEGDDAKR